MTFLDVTLKPRKEEVVEETEKKSKTYNWVYENSINNGQELLDIETQEFKYDQWRTNSTLSNFRDTIFYADMMNRHYHISNKMHYHFLFYAVRKTKRYNKKKTEQDKANEKILKQEQENLKLIMTFYKYNIAKAKAAMKVLTPEQLAFIKKKLDKGGVK